MHRIVTGLALAAGLAMATVVNASAQQYGNYNYPPGSYQQSCNNVSMRGSIIYASCSAPNGRQIYSSMNVNGCNGDIANVNGYLRCNGSYGYNNNSYNNNGYGYNNGRNDDEDDENGDEHHHHHPNGNAYGYYGNRDGGYNNNGSGYSLPPGSYQQSCTNERIYGSMLSASCTATNGQYINSSIDVRRCESQGSDIANRNGYLSC